MKPTRKASVFLAISAIALGLAACSSAASTSASEEPGGYAGSTVSSAPATPVGAAQTMVAMITGMTTADGATVTSATVGTTCTFHENGNSPLAGTSVADAIASGTALGVVNTYGIGSASCQWFALPISPQFWDNTGSYTIGIGELFLSDGTQYQALVVYAPDDSTASFVEAANPNG
jgi:hypothetical protein